MCCSINVGCVSTMPGSRLPLAQKMLPSWCREGWQAGSKVWNSSHVGKDLIDQDSSACRVDKLKEDAIEGYKIMTGLEKMNREGDSYSSDPRTREVSNKPASAGWERNKMRYSAPSMRFSFGAWTMGLCSYYEFFMWVQRDGANWWIKSQKDYKAQRVCRGAAEPPSHRQAA